MPTSATILLTCFVLAQAQQTADAAPPWATLPTAGEAVASELMATPAERVSPGGLTEDEPAPLAAANADAPLRISAPDEAKPLGLARPRGPSDVGRGNMPSLATVAGSLGIVLGLFFLGVWFLRRRLPGTSTTLPADVLETLGRSPLPGRQQLYLMRCGHKLLLVWVSPESVKTLTEITDPVEVDRLAGLCRQGHPQSATAAFRDVMSQLNRQESRPAPAPATSREVPPAPGSSP